MDKLNEGIKNINKENDSKLRIKLNIGSFNIEIEGASEDVNSQFDDLKKNGLGEIVDQLAPLINSPIQKINTKPNSDNTSQEPLLLEEGNTQNIDFTSLQNIVYKQLPNSETEWLLIYSYYLNSEGKNTFARRDFIQKYEESNRKTEQRIKNLSASIKGAVSKNWISALNETDFIITEKGKNYATQILSRKSER